MCTACIQAKHKQKIIKVKTKSTTKPFKLIYSDECGLLFMSTSTGHCYYILFIDDYTHCTSLWVLPDKKSTAYTSTNRSFQAQVDSMGYEVKQYQCDNGCREYDNIAYQLVLAGNGSTYEPCPRHVDHEDGIAKHVIQTITETARSLMIDSQVPLHFWGEAVNSVVYLHQQTPNKGLTKYHHCNGYQEPYSTPYEMQHAFGKPRPNNDNNQRSYKAPLHHLRGFSCYAS